MGKLDCGLDYGGFHLYLFPFKFPFIYISIIGLVPNGSSNDVVQMSVHCTSKEIGLEDASHFK